LKYRNWVIISIDILRKNKILTKNCVKNIKNGKIEKRD